LEFVVAALVFGIEIIYPDGQYRTGKRLGILMYIRGVSGR
jgi:hypothetical protein